MKRLSTLAVLAALTAAGSASATGSFSMNQFNSGVLPVLVQVDARGKVTHISSSSQLSPRYERLLRENIDELITGPARNKNKAVSSQFVLNMALKTTPRDDGSYDAYFAYVSARPVPSGPMHWVNIDGHRLALARDSDIYPERRRIDYSPRRSYSNHSQNQQPPPPPRPPANSTSSGARQAPRGH